MRAHAGRLRAAGDGCLGRGGAQPGRCSSGYEPGPRVRNLLSEPGPRARDLLSEPGLRARNLLSEDSGPWGGGSQPGGRPAGTLPNELLTKVPRSWQGGSEHALMHASCGLPPALDMSHGSHARCRRARYGHVGAVPGVVVPGGHVTPRTGRAPSPGSSGREPARPSWKVT